MNVKDVKFEQLRESIHQALWYANQCLENYQELDSAIHSGKTGINQFYHFFLYAELAFYRCFISNVFNAIHKPKSYKTGNIEHLHNYVQSHRMFPTSFKDSVEELLNMIKDNRYKNTINKIEFERNKYISHNELIQHGVQTSVSYAEAKQFIDALMYKFDDISTKYDGAILTYDLPFLHAKQLLQHLDKRYSEKQP